MISRILSVGALRRLKNPLRGSVVAALAAWGILAFAKEPPPEQSLFDGQTLNGWSVLKFGGDGPVKILPEGVLEIGAGSTLSGLLYTNRAPRMDYEISLDARRVEGSDFFCGLTFPVGSNSCTLVLGGWGGWVTGLSSVNGMDASENETTRSIQYEMNRWYHLRIRVTAERIEAWLDQTRIVDVEWSEKRISMRPGDIEQCAPLGLATWQTRGQIRNLKLSARSP